MFKSRKRLGYLISVVIFQELSESKKKKLINQSKKERKVGSKQIQNWKLKERRHKEKNRNREKKKKKENRKVTSRHASKQAQKQALTKRRESLRASGLFGLSYTCLWNSADKKRMFIHAARQRIQGNFLFGLWFYADSQDSICVSHGGGGGGILSLFFFLTENAFRVWFLCLARWTLGLSARVAKRITKKLINFCFSRIFLFSLDHESRSLKFANHASYWTGNSRITARFELFSGITRFFCWTIKRTSYSPFTDQRFYRFCKLSGSSIFPAFWL